MNSIDKKIEELLEYTLQLPYVIHDTDGKLIYLIKNFYTDEDDDVIILCPISDGFEKAIDLAIKEIKAKREFYFQ